MASGSRTPPGSPPTPRTWRSSPTSCRSRSRSAAASPTRPGSHRCTASTRSTTSTRSRTNSCARASRSSWRRAGTRCSRRCSSTRRRRSASCRTWTGRASPPRPPRPCTHSSAWRRPAGWCSRSSRTTSTRSAPAPGSRRSSCAATTSGSRRSPATPTRRPCSWSGYTPTAGTWPSGPVRPGSRCSTSTREGSDARTGAGSSTRWRHRRPVTLSYAQRPPTRSATTWSGC